MPAQAPFLTDVPQSPQAVGARRLGYNELIDDDLLNIISKGAIANVLTLDQLLLYIANANGGRVAAILKNSGAAASVSSGTTETQLSSIAVPAGYIGLNGLLRITLRGTCTSNANTKWVRLRYSGPTGIRYIENVLNTDGQWFIQSLIGNANSLTAQRSFPSNIGNFGNDGATSETQSSVNTALATTIYISGQTQVSGDVITLRRQLVEFLPGV